METPAPVLQSIIVGTYTKKEGHVNGKAQGIHLLQVDEKGALTGGEVIAPDIINPSYLAVSADGKYLYAASETGGDVDSVAYIHAYRQEEDGQWTFLNRQSSHSFAPCYVAVHPSGKAIAIANYVGGIVAMYPIREDGSLAKATTVTRLEGGSDHPRQDSSHPHATVFNEAGTHCYVPDLGSNKVWVFEVNLGYSMMQLNEDLSIDLQAAAGPRHMVFHPNGKYAYVANELDNTTVVMEVQSNGGLSIIQTLSTLPPETDTESYVADIHITPDGNNLYVSNRGDNSLAHYEVDPAKGTLDLLMNYPTKGDFPRNFVIDPEGTFLYVANQNGDNIVAFAIGEDGALTEVGEINSPTPVCLKFLPE